jgi:hypothetical protein
MEISVIEAQPPPTHCPTCDVELVVDFQCGRYIILKCGKCKLNIRSFPPLPLGAFYDEGFGEGSVDLDALIAEGIDRKPRKIDIPMFDLDALEDGLG